MNTTLFQEVRERFPQLELRRDVPFRDVTTLGVGSRLPVLAEVVSEAELSELLKFAASRRFRVLILGNGSNLVGSDEPPDALAVRLAARGFCALTVDAENRIHAGARVSLPALAARAAELKLGGLAPLSGIPGSLGGALRMNAGAHGCAIGTFVRNLSGFFLDGSPWSATGDAILWEYHHSSIPDNVVITEAVLELPAGDPRAEAGAIAAEQEARRSREPGGRNAGCTFRNVSELEPAGKLIDACGLKNYRVGDAEVSSEHANYIINRGAATEAQFLELMHEIRRNVAEKFGFYLQPEVCFISTGAREALLNDPVAPRVNVLYGGVSSEREISLRSGDAVAAALRNAGFPVELTDLKECRLTDSMLRADVVYPVLHGGFGEGGELQKVMEAAKCRFTGSGSAACELVMDKIATKRLLDRIGIPTARWCVLTAEARTLPEEFTYPVVLKAPREGSTIGIAVVKKAGEFDSALNEELKLAPEILAEEFIEGVEITIPVVNGAILPGVEIRSPHGFYDYDAKYVYKDGHTEYFCPIRSLSTEVVERAARYAFQFYLAARCRDILRVDFIVSSDGTPYMLEGNALPGCTATSLVPKSARVAGISFEKMVSDQVYAALRRPVQEPDGRDSATSSSGVPDGDVTGAGRGGNGAALNRTLVRVCRWMFCLALLLGALSLLVAGVRNWPSGLPFILNGVLLVCAGPVFHWLMQLEKK